VRVPVTIVVRAVIARRLGRARRRLRTTTATAPAVWSVRPAAAAQNEPDTQYRRRNPDPLTHEVLPSRKRPGWVGRRCGRLRVTRRFFGAQSPGPGPGPSQKPNES